jgi:hypothetical protein
MANAHAFGLRTVDDPLLDEFHLAVKNHTSLSKGIASY